MTFKRVIFIKDKKAKHLFFLLESLINFYRLSTPSKVSYARHIDNAIRMNHMVQQLLSMRKMQGIIDNF